MTLLATVKSRKKKMQCNFRKISKSLKNMKNDKSPGLDGFTVNYFIIFLSTDLKYFILRSFNYGYRT